jgi:hypothetical protein
MTLTPRDAGEAGGVRAALLFSGIAIHSSMVGRTPNGLSSNFSA